MITMHRILQPILISLVIMGIWCCAGHNGRRGPDPENNLQDTVGQAIIEFDTLYHDYGTIIEGEKVACYFRYGNAGNTDLVIESVESTCGCTSPEWKKEPLRPGETEHLKVLFDSGGRAGVQRKRVSVLSNAVNPVIHLTLVAEVKRVND